MAKFRGLCGMGAVLLCLGISGCGDSDSSPTATPTPTPAPTLPPPSVLAHDNFSLDAGLVVAGLFETSSTGTIDALVNYGSADSLVTVWLARGECTFELFSADQCSYVATSLDAPPPRSPPTGGMGSAITVVAASQPAGTYTLIISNGGPRTETFAVQVLFIPSTGASSRAGGSGLSFRHTGHWLGQQIVPGG